MSAADLSPAQRHLLAHANEAMEMARDLGARGLKAESIVFALAASEMLRAVRALSEVNEAVRAPEGAMR